MIKYDINYVSSTKNNYSNCKKDIKYKMGKIYVDVANNTTHGAFQIQ